MMKAIFLDRDGTIVKDKNYLSDPAQLEWLPGAIEGLKILKSQGFEFFLVTNQSGIGRGYFSEAQLKLVHARLNAMMVEAGIGEFLAIEYCPHAPDFDCTCRKPKSDMIEKLVTRFNIDREKSWMVGDKDIDALCGKNALVQSAIVGKNFHSWAEQNNFSFFDDLASFAQTISMQTKKYQSIVEFYPFYLSQHLHPISRYLHVYATSMGVIIALTMLSKGYFLLFPLGLVVGYVGAWIGHFVFEKNRPATFKYPLYSFACDFLMIKDFFKGTLDEKIAQVKLGKNS